jgi:hypothetical protein
MRVTVRHSNSIGTFACQSSSVVMVRLIAVQRSDLVRKWIGLDFSNEKHLCDGIARAGFKPA